MIKKGLWLFLLSFSLGSLVLGETFNGPTHLHLKIFDILLINGPAELKLVKARSLEIRGTLKFHKLDVSDNTIIHGMVSGDQGKFDKLDVTGTLDVDHVICQDLHVQGKVQAIYLEVKNQADILGPLTAKHSKFQSLAVTAETIELEDVTLDSLLIRNTEKRQTLILKGTTTVNGDITFESGEGTIQTEGTNVVIKGKVQGAT